MEREDFEEYEDYIERLKKAIRQREAQLSALKLHLKRELNSMRWQVTRLESENDGLRRSLAFKQNKIADIFKILLDE